MLICWLAVLATGPLRLIGLVVGLLFRQLTSCDMLMKYWLSTEGDFFNGAAMYLVSVRMPAGMSVGCVDWSDGVNTLNSLLMMLYGDML